MNYSIVGKQILKFRKEKGLTQKELGEAIGVSSSAVSQWESGGTPDISLLPALSDVFGVTVDALFGRTEVRRENIEEIIGKHILSLPENKRLEWLIPLIRRVVLMGCTDAISDVVNFDSRDSEMTHIVKDGFVTAISSQGQTFLSATWCEENIFTDSLSFDKNVTQLFSVLATSSALAMLSRLYSEAPRHRTIGVLAKLVGISQSEAEKILQKFTELKLTEELELETENGSEKVYAVNLNGVVVSLLISARLVTRKLSEIKIISDKREHRKECD
ncbi:MAG: helix-turn-helix domain-containing protein [Anaeroplasmataceae bacterium]|nr:helix-turn-helix domain-containing protein [Anaeroplasmataceae bacterium]